MSGGFREIKPGERHKGQRIKRTGAGAKKTVVETHAAASDQRERQTIQATLTIGFAKLRHQQKVQPNADHQQRQDLLQNIGLHVLHQQRPRRRADKRHQNIEFLIGKIYHLATDKVERRGNGTAARL